MDKIPPYYRALVPNGSRRAPWHDYHGRSIYMITLNKAAGVAPFSNIIGRLDSRDWKPRAMPSSLGEMVGRNMSSLKGKFPFIKILRRVIMPEHLHFVLFVTEKTEYHLGEIIKHLKGECTRNYHGLDEKREEDYGDMAPVFEAAYHDRILLKEGQLQRMLSYVSDNPRRRLERMTRPDFFQRNLLVDSCGNHYEAYGNIHLLEDIDIEAVRVSSKYTPEELRRKKLCWLHTVQNGGVLVSPFISAAEKRVRDWACDNGGRFITIVENGFGRNFTPKGISHALCGEGRLLMVAPTEHKTAKMVCRRQDCMRMNELAATIAAYGLHRI